MMGWLNAENGTDEQNPIEEIEREESVLRLFS